MSRSFSLGKHRVLFVVTASLLLGLSCAAASAIGATVQANCSDLQADLNVASGGETIVLSELCSAVSYTLPSGAAFTLEGAPGTTSGFDGTGLTHPQLSGSSVEGLTLSDLTFENSAASSEGALVLHHSGGSLTLENDRFFNDSTSQPSPAEIVDGKTGCGAASGSVVVKGSVFEGNTGAAMTSGLGAGGGLLLDSFCGLDEYTFTGNTFTGNTLKPAAGQPGSGGGLAIFDDDASNLAHVTQSGNVFDSNTVVANGSSRYVGGGEETSGVDLTSTGDRFSRNTLPGTGGKENYSWGAGLSIEDDNCQAAAPESTLTNDVLAADTIEDIGSDESKEALGAGVYVGSLCKENGFSNHLTVRDSTVTENRVTPAGEGAVAGIDGHPRDQLSLENSILYGDIGGAELGGFTGEGGSLAASYSDVCNGTSPFAGTGNICANPLLADNGNPESIDVHETSTSPTIDKGSNALVPSGLSTDFYGKPRIQPSEGYLPACTPGATIGLKYYPAVVDMGASELAEPALAAFAEQCPNQVVTPGPVVPAPGLTRFISVKTNSTGIALKLSCSSTDGQGCSGAIVLNAAETLRGKKIVAVSSKVTKVAVRIAEGSFAIASGQTSTVRVKLNSTGLALLRHFHAMPAVVLANEAMPNNSTFLFLFHTVRFSESKQKHKSKKHKSAHPKHRH